MDEYILWLATKDPPFIQNLKFRVQFKCAHWRGLTIGSWKLEAYHLLPCGGVIARQAAAAARTPASALAWRGVAGSNLICTEIG